MKYKWFAEQKLSKAGLKRKERLEKWKLNRLLKFTKPGIKLLEIGPGIGIFAELCRKSNNIEYYAIESNQKLYEDLLNRGFALKKADVPPVPHPDTSMDVVYIDQVVEHMQGYKEAIALISESYRVLAQKGFIVIIVPNYLTEKGMFFDIDYTHNLVTTERRIHQMLIDHNFRIILSKKYICGLTGIMANLLDIILIPIKSETAGFIFSLLGLKKLLLMIRKNLFELLIIIGQK